MRLAQSIGREEDLQLFKGYVRIDGHALCTHERARQSEFHVFAGDEDELWKRSDAAHERLLGSADVREGIAAFFERREPNWQAR